MSMTTGRGFDADDMRLFRELVSMNTDSVEKSNYVEASRLLQKELDAIGARVTIVNAPAPDGKPRPNLVGYIDNGKDETVGLCSHFDVVPVTGQEWETDPFNLVISGRKAFGRGVNDDKAEIVASIAAVKSARSNANVEFIIACDEEVGSEYGTKWVLQNRRKLIKSTHAVVLDTSKKITVGSSGTTMGKITVLGKEAHAGYPHLATNAITSALPFLSRLSRFSKIAGKSVSKYGVAGGLKIYGRFSITMLHAGFKENIIPGRLEARFDMRSIPEISVERLRERFSRYFEKARKASGVDATLEFTGMNDGYCTDPREKIVRMVAEATGLKEFYGTFGSNDGSFFHRAGIPVVAYGCTNVTHHKANEYVDLDEMLQLKREIARLLEIF